MYVHLHDLTTRTRESHDTITSVNTPIAHIDHLVYAAPDLDTGCAAFAELTGVEPTLGGRHDTGTHNALASLGSDVYIEILAAQPGSTSSHPWVTHCQSLTAPHLFTFCVRPPSIAQAAATSRELGFDGVGPFAMTRTTASGEVLAWELFTPGPTPFGGAYPFFIDWGHTPHPATTSPAGTELLGLAITTDQPDALASHFGALGLGAVAISQGPDSRLSATLSTPRGVVTLS